MTTEQNLKNPVEPKDGITVNIINAENKKSMAIEKGSTADFAKLVQEQRDDTKLCQQFRLSLDKSAGTTAWYISPRHALAKVLDVHDGSTVEGAPIIQYSKHTAANQKWRIINDDGGYILENVGSELVLQPENGSSAFGIPIVQMKNNGKKYQKWILNGTSP
ncbi:MAG: RICIN domain-containing protein [Nitrososphaerota archaeon]|jgi:hypothetical protein|nr:RICIN domain-containing protein [Nitrososphaerota archaeon]